MRTRLVLFVALLPILAAAQDAGPTRCDDTPLYRELDFWIGEWDVYVGDNLVGHNLIEKTLGGCAVIENWTASDGGDGKSLFFVDYDRRWIQIWVTEWAVSPGGVKEKVMVDDPPTGSVRFQGVVRHPDAGAWLDRTTLTPRDDGSVRQVIEISEDNGETWSPTFDAVYRPAGQPEGDQSQ